MFNFKRTEENNNNSDEKNIKQELLKYSASKDKSSTLNSIAAESGFIKEDLKIRSMVIKALEKEFGKEIKNIKNYDYLVDSVVNRLKKKQLDAQEKDED